MTGKTVGKTHIFKPSEGSSAPRGGKEYSTKTKNFRSKKFTPLRRTPSYLSPREPNATPQSWRTCWSRAADPCDVDDHTELRTGRAECHSPDPPQPEAPAIVGTAATNDDEPLPVHPGPAQPSAGNNPSAGEAPGYPNSPVVPLVNPYNA